MAPQIDTTDHSTGHSTGHSLAVEALTCWRGENLLFDELSFAVQPGHLVQIAGTNGSGKTTLLRMLCGLGLPDEGEVLWCGQPVRKVREQLHDELAFVGHQDGVKGDLTPIENLTLERSLNRSRADVDPHEALEMLGLFDRDELSCRHLSAGQRRRVALARLLVTDARLWILDEPLTALDVRGRAVFEEQLLAQAERGGMVVFTTHFGLQMDGVQTVDLSDRQIGA